MTTVEPHVIATTDGSERSFRVLPHAAALATATGLPLAVLRVIGAPQVDLTRFPDADPRVHRDAIEARGSVDAGLQQLAIEAETLVVRRHERETVHHAIIRSATAQAALVIAMDSRGAGSLVRHAAIGSITLQVVRRSHLPVLVTGPAVAEPGPPGHYRILCVSDATPEAENILRALASLLARPTASAELMRVDEMSPKAVSPSRRASLAREMEALKRLLPWQDDIPVHIEPIGREGLAGRIVDLAMEHRVQAIGIATGGHSALRRLARGSLAVQIVEQSPLPVILTHSG